MLFSYGSGQQRIDGNKKCRQIDGNFDCHGNAAARLHIPVFRNLFFGSKKPFLTGFLRISFFSCVFRRNFSQERGFGEVAGIPFFFDFTGIFRRNSCGEEFLPETLSFLQHVLLVWGVNLLTLVCKLLFFYVQIMRYSENRKFTDKEICK